MDNNFTIIYSDPVIRYDNNGNHFILIRDPKAPKIKKYNDNYDEIQYQDDNSNYFDHDKSVRPLPSLRRFMSQKQSALDTEFDEIESRIQIMNVERQKIHDKLKKLSLKKNFIDQQNELLSEICAAESGSNDCNEASKIHDKSIQIQHNESPKHVRFEVDLSHSEQLKSRKHYETSMSQNDGDKFQLYQNLLLYKYQMLQQNRSDLLSSLNNTDITDFVGILEIKIVKLEIRPWLITNGTTCSVTLNTTYGGSGVIYRTNEYDQKHGVYHFDKLHIFKIQQVFKNSIIIEIMFDNVLQDRIRLSTMI